MSPDALRALREKYIELRSLRLCEDPRPRARLRALAVRFPGALREIDRLPMDTLEARIAALAEPVEVVPPWARTLVAFHGWMRVVLRARGRFGRDAEVDALGAWLRATHRAAEGEPALEELLDRRVLEKILRPPGGRASAWVLEHIAHKQARTRGEVEAEAFSGG